MIRLVLAAPYASVRAGLHSLLVGAEDCEVVGQVSGSGELEQVLPGLSPQIVLLDSLPGEVARVSEALRGAGTGLVVLGEGPGDGTALPHSGLAAWAWLRKQADTQEIIGAVRAVAAGLVVVDPAYLPFLAHEAPSVRDDSRSGETLTVREREVLQLMAQGLPNKVIAVRLSISLHTVKFHVASILAKLAASSRTEAVTLGARRGWILL